MIEFPFAWKHIEVKQAEWLAGRGIAHDKELEIIDPFIRHGDLIEFQAEDVLIDGEHASSVF